MTGAAVKTIAVHLPTAALSSRLLDAAIPLAKAHGATLIGVHVLPAVVVYADATISMSTEFIVAQQEAFREDARAVEAAFHAKVDGSGVAFEWSTSDTGDEPTMRAASTACNVADLVVASQYHDSIPAAAGYSPDELVLGTGRPVLIVPVAGNPAPVGKRVLIAWNGSREASRAAFDCLSLLQPDAEMRIDCRRQPARQRHARRDDARAVEAWNKTAARFSLEKRGPLVGRGDPEICRPSSAPIFWCSAATATRGSGKRSSAAPRRASCAT